MSRPPRTLAAVTLSLALLGACSGQNPYQTSGSTAASGVVGDNEYLPDRNVSDCVGTLERPDCGSSAKGGPEMYLVLGILVLGLAFVGRRIVVGVRRRDAVVNAGLDAEGLDPAPPDA